MRECPFMWPGMDATATEADAYTGKPATHAVEAARDMRNILTDWSRACGTTRQSGLHRSHDGRHVIPEGARVMKLPRWSMRDTIGYWRSSSAVADETDADAARTAALHVIPECARVMTSSPGPCKTRLAIGVHQAPSRTKQTWMRRAPRPYVSRALPAPAWAGAGT